MERDALVSHGASFLMNDRMMNCSDKHSAFACSKCGNLISTMASVFKGGSGATARTVRCTNCDASTETKQVTVPYVLTYLINELATVNIKTDLSLE